MIADNFDEEPDECKAMFADRLQAFCGEHVHDLLDGYALLSDTDFFGTNPTTATLLYSLIALGGSGDLDEALRRLNG